MGCLVWREPAESNCTRMCHQSDLMPEFTKKNATVQDRDTRSQSKCTWTFHNNHFVEIYRTSTGCKYRGFRFVRVCAVKMPETFHQNHLVAELRNSSWFRSIWVFISKFNPTCMIHIIIIQHDFRQRNAACKYPTNSSFSLGL